MMETGVITDAVLKRECDNLNRYAEEYLESNDWLGLLDILAHSRSQGKSRDALVSLLELEAVGGTDSDVFKVFSDLEGTTLHQIRAHAIERSMEILKQQIENRHTYFLNIEEMAETPYAILVKDIIDARKRELVELGSNPSRIEVLGTFYGFMILIIDGSHPQDITTHQQNPYRYYYSRHRRTWLDTNISDSAANAIKKLTGDFAVEVDMDKTYRTLGSSRIFKSRCTRNTAEILANAVRLSLYMVPGNRSSAAAALGRTEDVRVLPFLHHRIRTEQSAEVRKRIAEALGKVSYVDSLDILKEQVSYPRRGLSKEQDAIISAIGGIFSPKSKEILFKIIKSSGNSVKSAAIRALGTQSPEGLVHFLAPYLRDRSRPIVRASVLTLTELGQEGYDTILRDLVPVLKTIGNDRPSQVAVHKILQNPSICQKRELQYFFAKRIYNLRKDAENWKKRNNSSPHSWWYRNREQRAERSLTDVVRMVVRHLQPPYQKELLHSIQESLRAINTPEYILREIGGSDLGKTILEGCSSLIKNKMSVTSEHTYFV